MGSLGVPGCARTPLGPGGEAKIKIQAKIYKGASQIQGVSYAEFPLYTEAVGAIKFRACLTKIQVINYCLMSSCVPGQTLKLGKSGIVATLKA